MPKGYDQTLVKKGFPSGTLHSIAKALDMDWDLEKGESSEEDGSPVKCEGCGKTLNPVEMVMGKYPVCMKCVAKRHGEVVNPSSAKAPIKKSLGEQLSVAIAEHLEKAGATSKCNSCGKRVSVDKKMQSAGITFGNAHDDICANCVRTHAENLDGVKHEARASATDVKRGYSPELQNRMTQNRDRMRASFTTDAYQRLGVQQPKGITGRSTDTPIEKAMVAGDGIVQHGANIGASALKKQELKGVRTCKGCGKGITTTTADFCTSCTKLGKKETGVLAVEKAQGGSRQASFEKYSERVDTRRQPIEDPSRAAPTYRRYVTDADSHVTRSGQRCAYCSDRKPLTHTVVTSGLSGQDHICKDCHENMMKNNADGLTDYTQSTRTGKKETGVTAVEKAILNHPSFLSQIAKR
jgi:hypothetical protein